MIIAREYLIRKGIAFRDVDNSIDRKQGLAIIKYMKNEVMQKLGRKGGLQTKKRYGLSHFSRIGKLGGRPKKLSTEDTSKKTKRDIK